MELSSPAKSISSYLQQHQHNFSSHALVPNLSGMLLEFYQKNSLNVPKNNKIQKFLATSPPPYNKSLSIANNETELNLSSKSSKPLSLLSSSANATSTVVKSTPETSNNEEFSAKVENLTASSNDIAGKKLSASFHPRIKYSNVNNKPSIGAAVPSTSASSLCVTSLPSSVIPAPVIQPPIMSAAPSAAAIAAAAFFRGDYRNLQQLQAQEFLSHQQPHPPAPVPPTVPKNPPFFIPSYLKNTNSNDRSSDADDQSQSEDEDGDDDVDEDEDSKYPSIEDIHLIEGSKSVFHNQSMPATESDYLSDESHKYSMIAAQALRNLEYSLSDYGGNGTEEQLYNCRHCGKKYRWKSTLRRHENVECGGKEPSHQCPYCPYKSKQRGNLGVHVRKHHSNLPQLASKRRSKYSQPRD